MTQLLFAEINMISAAVLLLLFFNRANIGHRQPDQRLFDRILWATFAMLVLDSAMWLLDGRTEPGALSANRAATVLYYVCTPLPCYLWMLYCDFRVHGSKKRMRRIARFGVIPMAVNAALAVASLYAPIFFTVGDDNVYARAPLFFIHALLAYTYFAFVTAGTILEAYRAPRYRRTELVFLALFPLPPLIGSVLQTIFFGTSLTWVLTALSLLVIYLNVQNLKISHDSLTGTNNRRRFYAYLESRIRQPVADRTLYALVIDIDSFKRVNDVFGHVEGDAALKQTADLLKQVCGRRKCFLARIGGDEFAILTEAASDAEVQEVVGEIDAVFDRENAQSDKGYRLTVSTGVARYDAKAHASPTQLVAAADADMYRRKKSKAASVPQKKIAEEGTNEMENGDWRLTIRAYCGRDRVFGPGVAELLEGVEELHSLRAATKRMDMSYSKAWRIVGNAERALGFPLLDTRAGGRDGGGAALTDQARKLVVAYRAFSKDVDGYAHAVANRYFMGIWEEQNEVL